MMPAPHASACAVTARAGLASPRPIVAGGLFPNTTAADFATTQGAADMAGGAPAPRRSSALAEASKAGVAAVDDLPRWQRRPGTSLLDLPRGACLGGFFSDFQFTPPLELPVVGGDTKGDAVTEWRSMEAATKRDASVTRFEDHQKPVNPLTAGKDRHPNSPIPCGGQGRHCPAAPGVPGKSERPVVLARRIGSPRRVSRRATPGAAAFAGGVHG